MWYMPIAMYGMSKMQEGRQREEAKKQQLHSIRSNLASQFGSPGYGEATVKNQYELNRRLDEERRKRNAAMLESVFSNMNGGQQG